MGKSSTLCLRQGVDRDVAHALQSGSAAQLFGLPATSAGGGSRAVDISRILTLGVVLNVGADQSCGLRSFGGACEDARREDVGTPSYLYH